MQRNNIHAIIPSAQQASLMEVKLDIAAIEEQWWKQNQELFKEYEELLSILENALRSNC